jgi:bacterioferritin-associated ferredoxin
VSVPFCQNWTRAEIARALRNCYDSLQKMHENLELHDGWAKCPCQIADVLRNVSRTLEPTMGWFKERRKLR